MHAYISYTPASDTTELATRFRGIPQSEIPTEAMHPVFDMRPATRVEGLGYRLRHNLFLADVKDGVRQKLAIMGGFGIAFAGLLAYHGAETAYGLIVSAVTR